MIKQVICLGFAAIVGLASAVSAGDYSGGNGTAEKPYQISTPENMNEIGNHSEDWDKHFVLTNNINLSAYTGTEFNIIGNNVTAFTGVFDGKGHTISNFTYKTTDAGYFGIFWYVDDVNAVIKDLTLNNPNIEVWQGWGSTLVGRLRAGRISGCGVDGGSVSGKDNIGGLVGENEEGTVESCYATANIAGETTLGGLVGNNYNGMISNCYATGSVAGDSYTGSLAGANSGTISNCHAEGSIAGDNNTGGLVGVNSGTISNCYAASSVTGDNHTGGLAGVNSGTISNCYTAGGVTGNYRCTGGLVGNNWKGTIENCHTSSRVLADTDVSDLVKENDGGKIKKCCSGGVVGVDENDVLLALRDNEGALAGGLVGANRKGTIIACYATGRVNGVAWVGGFVGCNYSGTIENCYATGIVDGNDFVGGLIGYDYDDAGDYTKSFWDKEVNPDVNGIGNASDPNVIGESTRNMQTQSTYTDVGWDFVTPIWTIDEGNDYPRLWRNSIPIADRGHL